MNNIVMLQGMQGNNEPKH